MKINSSQVNSATPIPIVNHKRKLTEGEKDFLLTPQATQENEESSGRYTTSKRMSTLFDTLGSNQDDAIPFDFKDDVTLIDKKGKKVHFEDSSDECELKSLQSDFEDEEEEKKDLAYKLVDVDVANDPMLGRKSV